jgi:PAS domain S-box-containing protein
VGVVFQDAEGRITQANPAALSILGLTLEQLQGRTSLDPRWRSLREDGSDYPGEEHPAMVALRTGEPVHGALMSVHNPLADEQRWILIDATPLFSPGEDAPREVYTTLQDITELRRAELARRESEARFRLTFDQAPLGAVLSDLSFRFTDVNESFCVMLGYTRDELLQMTFADVTHPDDVEVDVREVGRLAAGEIGEHIREKRYIRKDGAVVWGRVVVRPVVDAAGEHIAQLAMIDDITERKAADQALRRSETRYRIVADNTYDWEWWLDPQGDFVYCSPGCAEITGYGPEEFMRDSGRLLEIVHPDDRERVRAHLRTDGAETQDAAVVEFRVLTGDGHERILDHRCRPVFAADGTWLGRRASNRDVTERRKAEEEVRRLNEELRRRVVSRTEQLDAATRELEALAYSIAHDVRAPLRTIDGFSAAVIEDEYGLSGEGVASLQRVRAAAQTLARLLDDLMGLSRVSRRELARERIDLSEVAGEVAGEVAREHPSRRVELSIAPGLSADADPMLARLILRELIANAWKFTARREVAHVEVGSQKVDDELAFFVRDDGVGFDLRYAEHLFGVFQRMHPPGEFEGDGVGLAMVQRLVRRHGGRCWAEAEVDHGATFFFRLPDEASAAD